MYIHIFYILFLGIYKILYSFKTEKKNQNYCSFGEVFLGLYLETYSILLSLESPNTTSETVKHLINFFNSHSKEQFSSK